MSGKSSVKYPFYFSYFEKLYESWEKSTSQALQFWFKNPLFINCVEKAVEKSLEFKNYTQDIIERTLNYRYLPVKNNFHNLMNNIDKKDIDLVEKDKRFKGLQTHNKSKRSKNMGKTKSRRKKQ